MKKCFMLCAVLYACVFLAGCKKDPLDPKNPVTLAFWHHYSQNLKTSIDMLIDEFNSTVGAEKGIIIKTEYVGDTVPLNERILFAASDDPGSPRLPDIAVLLPRVAITMAEKHLLVDLTDFFTEKELSEYVSDFLDEGRLKSESLFIMPLAKSTEVLYVNNTIFERFSKDTGVTLGQLSTMEGILDAAAQYYQWSGGKAFIHHTYLFNYAMIGYQQLGEEFIADNKLNLSSPAFRRIWDGYFTPAVNGQMTIFDGFGEYLMATGDVICVTSTSAGVTFFSDTVTYPDNTKEDCDLRILPYPVFEGGKSIAIQRGAGFCVFKSEYKKEYAASVFYKWLTEPEQNLRFTADTGYMPVKYESFRRYRTGGTEITANENVKKLTGTIIQMQNEYAFYFPPVFDGFENLDRSFPQAFRAAAENAKRISARNGSPDSVPDNAMELFVTENR